uniref:Uncharacterized protein n=1 Tax=Rhizophora mucronata TaxID=61149 RepID=A0A2P2JJ33_RHIMU
MGRSFWATQTQTQARY